MIFNALATYAQIGNSPDGVHEGRKALFISNLLDILEGLLSTPLSPETLAILGNTGKLGSG